MNLGYIVTGTDTGVGKTIFAAGLAGHLRARYWKPIQAGLEDESDSDVARKLTDGRAQVLAEAYRLSTPCSPHEAARLDGVTIDPEMLELPGGHGPLIIEGAGGVLVPISNHVLAADQFARWALPVILVARTALGTINHSLLSLEAMRARGILVAGVVFSGDENLASEAAITEIGQCAHLGRIPFLNPLTAERLSQVFAKSIRVDLLK